MAAVVRGRLLRLAFYAALLAMAARVGLLLEQAAAAGGAAGSAALLDSAWRIVAGTSYGERWLLGQGLLAALGTTVWFLLHQTAYAALAPSHTFITPPHAAPATPYTVPPTPHAAPATPHAAPLPKIARKRWHGRYAAHTLAAPLVLALVVVQALQSHATAFNDFSLARIAAAALHVLAAGIWAGGVLALAVAVVPLLRGGPERVALAWGILRRFGALAAAALAALLISGLFMSGQQVASLDALLTTRYGQALLIKIGLAAVVALIGLRNAAAIHPRLAAVLRWPRRRTTATRRVESESPPPTATRRAESESPPLPSQWERGTGGEGQRRLAYTIALEAAGALVVLLLAATLSATPPARGPTFEPRAETAAPPGVTTNAGDLVVTLAVKPNRPGRNFISMGVFNTRRPAPAPIDTVVIRLQAPGEAISTAPLVAEPLGDGRYQIAGGDLPTAGDWRITVSVRRPDMPDTTTTIPWTVSLSTPLVDRHPILVSDRPLGPALTFASALIALVLSGTLLGRWSRRRLPSTLAFARSLLARRRPRLLRKE